MPLLLTINNIGFAFSFIVCLSLGILVYVRRPKENDSVNKVFIINSIFVCIWQASYVIGTNLSDPLWSRFAFMFNLAALFVVLMNIHLLLAITGRFPKHKKVMTVLYFIAGAFVVFFALNPDLFMLASKPQLYLPNFFVPGPLYVVQDTFFFLVFIYFVAVNIISYRSADTRMRNRLKYFIGGFICGYAASLIPEFLLYGIHVDPIWSSLTGLYTIPMAYAIIQYDIIDINIIARRALIYGLGTAGIAIFILFIGYANDTVASIIPGFPQWLLPLASGLLGVMLGVFIWKKVQEVDHLKFQFVDVVTHKFRTPLTHIKWSAENLRSETNPKERAAAITAIEEADMRLFEMTNSLIGLAHSDENQYKYVLAPEHVADILNETLSAIENQVRAKKIDVRLHIEPNLPRIFVDRKRLQFVIQMIIENAVIYSTSGSIVNVVVEQRGPFIYLSVHDFGIGISKEDMEHLFARFFRGSNATEVHTEGMGIGLFVSQDIIRRHGGDLWAESAGRGKGSTFFIKIPLEK